MPECSLAYTKLMQTSGKKTCFQLPECSLAYAKIHIFHEPAYCVNAPDCTVVKKDPKNHK